MRTGRLLIRRTTSRPCAVMRERTGLIGVVCRSQPGRSRLRRVVRPSSPLMSRFGWWRFLWRVVNTKCGQSPEQAPTRDLLFEQSRNAVTAANAEKGRNETNALQSRETYSITSSAVTRSVVGMVKPSAFAVLRFMLSATSVACSIGSSDGLSPLRIRST